MNRIWWVIIPVVLSGLIGWGAWATVLTTNATPRKVHDGDIKEVQEILREQQKETIDRLERIWDKIK